MSFTSPVDSSKRTASIYRCPQCKQDTLSSKMPDLPELIAHWEKLNKEKYSARVPGDYRIHFTENSIEIVLLAVAEEPSSAKQTHKWVCEGTLNVDIRRRVPLRKNSF